tara:strand:- start:200 stop:535 length:336 start_codon:yes stop_codon:yes gene_type:complete
MNVTTKLNSDSKKNEFKILIENKKETTYLGWWIYGEGNHIFKDELTLEEWRIEFVNEQIEEINKLYLDVCEMEYFPMACRMIGHLRKDIVNNYKTLVVKEFEILYVQGCDE